MAEQEPQQPVPEARWTWSQFPGNRIEAARMMIPLACTYAPLSKENVQVLDSTPQQCRTCKAILNPFCERDGRSVTWSATNNNQQLCPFCNTKTNFPQQFAETGYAPELDQASTTMEYRIPAASSPHPFYLFVIDLCVGSANKQDIDDLKEALLEALNFLPQDALVGVITFGTAISIHEMTPDALQQNGLPSKIYTLKGSKSYGSDQLAKLLRIPVPTGAIDETKQARGYAPGAIRNSFFAQLGDVEMSINQLFENLEPDPWPVKTGYRQRRCTGSALSAAASLADILFPGSGGRIMLFLSGPCTEGPGIVVDTYMANVIRGHTDIKNDSAEAKHWVKSRQYYDQLSTKLVRNGHCVDAFLNALDQVGFAEMRSCVALTGGSCLLADSFANEKFVESFRKFFRTSAEGQFPKVYNARIEVQCSPNWKIAGASGPLTSSAKKTPSVAPETEMGIGGTSEWMMPTCDERTYLAFYFEVANTPKPTQYRFAQFTTKYQHGDGSRRLRVTTVYHRVAQTTCARQFIQCFDQQAAAILMARLASQKAEDGHLFDVLRWLDDHLIRVVSKFSTYQKDQPASLQLAPQMSMFPQFMFHLRRSQFLQVFNSSPDETCFYRLWLDRESVENALIMIQPTLLSYDTQSGPTPALLDSSSVVPKSILVLDTYFEVVVHYGEVIVAWRNADYQTKPGFEYFSDLLQQPKDHAHRIVKGRYPQPRFVECDHHTSQARLLYNVINPSVTHNEEEKPAQAGKIVYTDDAPLHEFLEHLKKLAVQR